MMNVPKGGLAELLSVTGKAKEVRLRLVAGLVWVARHTCDERGPLLRAGDELEGTLFVTGTFGGLH